VPTEDHFKHPGLRDDHRRPLPAHDGTRPRSRYDSEQPTPPAGTSGTTTEPESAK
jgi:hypothetical protein